MDFLKELFGLHTETLNTGQMVARAIAIFFIALLFIRVSGIRTLGTQTAFDHLTLLVLGAVLGRAIVSAQQPFFPSLAAVLVLVLLHRLTAWVTFKSHLVGKIFKGEAIVLIENGKINETNLRRTSITRQDLEESLHLFLSSDDFSDIKAAYLERSGEISIIKVHKE